MCSKITSILVCFVFVLGGTTIVVGQDYIGAAKCKMCHNKTTTGKQYDKWVNGPHAKALESLSNAKSLEYAKANNIADPTKEKSCLKCHSTYHSASEDLMLTLKESEGVSCESCHGPGSKYKSPSVMKSHEKSVAAGLIVPDKALCVKCHNKENPFHVPFDYEARLKDIAHPNPAAN